MPEKQHIVILGAGFGGLRAALSLSKKIRKGKLNAEISLIDRNAYHTYTPTLYEAATTSKETANYLQIKEIVTFPIEEIIKKTGINFIEDEVEKLDLVGGDIHCAGGRKLNFDYLVLALGSEPHHFGIQGLREHALNLKTFLDAIKIRDRIWELAESGQQTFRIIVGGGGSTGVELAGEIQGWLCELKEEFHECATKVTIVEAAPTILAGFPEKIVEAARKRIGDLGVEVLVSEAIAKADAEKITLQSGREMRYDILVWTGGVKASSLMGSLPLKMEKRGRVEVVSAMECLPQSPDLKLYGKIYGIGDAVCFYDPASGKPIPGVARAAISQADIVVNNIVNDLKGGKKHRQYKPFAYPYIIPIGGKWAIAKIGPLIISGFLGWILKGLVEINYLLSIMPLGKALRIWLKGLRIFIQNDRLG
ncbi:MAG: NAD(P)/FAD-dependent oxidoreductase [Candidatus Harrisonbacteria bacterium]|nr:NAD(P)/FAD-dependent oxidoreductase [Candidatus Harrisonbacteria bacterium]